MAVKSASSPLLLGSLVRQIYGRYNSTLAMELKKLTAEAAFSMKPVIRTEESDPTNHTSRHIGLFYTISPEDAEHWVSRGLSTRAYRSHRGFNETCLMVRSPGIELTSCLHAADYSVPNVRYIIYGRPGCGKSTTLAYVMHYCGRAGWFIVHEPWLPYHLRYSRHLLEPSSFQPGLLDHPRYATDWLAYFRKTNELLLSPSDGSSPPVTVNRYVWNKREVAEVGTPLTSLIDFGLARVKYSSDVMGAMMKELRHSSSAGLSRVLVAIDGLNVCWGASSSRRIDDAKHFYQASEFSSIQHWRRMLKSDWTGGAVVCTVDGLAPRSREYLKFKPLEVLGAENFKTIDPFIPVYVPEYSDLEAVSCIEYYRDRKFIQKDVAGTEAGRKELIALSCRNPEELYRISINW